jgi:methylenetetrahydrofolate reductase (NADPH)
MKPNSKLANAIEKKEFIVTAEYLPTPAADSAVIKAAAGVIGNHLTAVSVADNHSGVGTSSIAASMVFLQSGPEPIYQLVTRDRNRIALQSDLLGASALGIKNVVCTSGHHQTLLDCSESANVYDLDAIQLVWTVRQMRDKGTLLDGTAIVGAFSMLVGTVVNPFLRPMELNMIQLAKKIEAGADFVQTHPVFDISEFAAWLDAARKEDLTDKIAILAGVLPISSAEEAEQLRTNHTELLIPDAIIARLKAAGNADAQEKEGIEICAEIIGKIKGMKGVRGIHILSGGRERLIPKLRDRAGL